MSSILQAQIVAMLCCWDTRKEIQRGQNVAVQQPKPTPSFAGQFLKDYRKAHNLSQEQLAYDLSLEPRTTPSRVLCKDERPTNEQRDETEPTAPKDLTERRKRQRRGISHQSKRLCTSFPKDLLRSC